MGRENRAMLSVTASSASCDRGQPYPLTHSLSVPVLFRPITLGNHPYWILKSLPPPPAANPPTSRHRIVTRNRSAEKWAWPTKMSRKTSITSNRERIRSFELPLHAIDAGEAANRQNPQVLQSIVPPIINIEDRPVPQDNLLRSATNNRRKLLQHQDKHIEEDYIELIPGRITRRIHESYPAPAMSQLRQRSPSPAQNYHYLQSRFPPLSQIQRSYSCNDDSAVSVETMAITALPMDVWLKERLKKWVQLSGHEGSIVPATPHTLYKKQASNCSEARAYEAISRDRALDGFTPKYYTELQKDEERFIEIEDLLQQFADPTRTTIMDIKVGTRTFLESEVSNTKKRADLYEKMIQIDPDEPTPEEHKCKEITKLRYMQFRERESSSAQLGFRIEAAKMPGGQLQKNFKKVRTQEDVATTLLAFFGKEREKVRSQLVDRLKKMRDAIESSEFFSRYEVVGSSLLIVYDSEKVGCWMIDFAKSSPVPDFRTLDHRTPWIPGNNEDGYLTGVDNLLQILEELPAYGFYPNEQEELEQSSQKSINSVENR
ncbi:hypothetical protein WR25_16130 [Diploscapter pachys]|uniref:Kinase n=1 Tax=Diploscapter pachys TaxID=2018661 RepID=A0A2A2LB37_9BILA|nr:hypothetical protein WR25_16130 [Diploscapter pachys]